MQSRTITLMVGAGGLIAVALCFGVRFWPVHTARESPPRSQSAAARLSALDSSLRAIEDGERQAPRDRWDPEYVVARLGKEPERLFAWVRDFTYWIPYRGALRGPAGVLMDRQGNSLDRALLLATLLEKAGRTVRLAQGRLSEEQAIRLLPTLTAVRDQAFGLQPPPPRRGDALELGSFSARYALDAAQMERSLKTREAWIDHTRAELRARVEDQTRRLRQAIEPTHPGHDRGVMLAAALEAIREHWWVQVRSGDGWMDLDPLPVLGPIPELKVAVVRTMSLKDVADAPLYQEVAVRVIAEKWSATGTKERVALEHVLRPADLIGKPIAIEIWPNDLHAGSVYHGGAKRGWRDELLGQHAWSAALMIGSELAQAGTLSDAGDDPDSNDPAERGGPMGSLASAFSRSMNGGDTTPAQRKSTALSAAWLEFEIRIPGEAPRTIRRTLVDLIGPSARAASTHPYLALDETKRLTRALALSSRTEILPIACRLAPEFVTHLAAQTVLGSRELAALAVRRGPPPGGQTLEQAIEHSAPPLSPLYALALSRFVWSDASPRPFIARPNLLTSHQYLAATGTGIALRTATDIVTNEVGVSVAASDPFGMRLTQGVLDTNAESLLLPGSKPFGNAGDAFAGPGDWVTLAPPQEDGATGQISLPADVHQRIDADLADGFIVVAPRASVPMPMEPFAGWWRIDRSSGNALGLGGNGWGQAGEEVEQTANSASSAKRFSKAYLYIGKFLAGTLGQYVWCYAAQVDEETKREGGFGLGPLKGALVLSERACVGDAVVVGGGLGLVTAPLLSILLEESSAARLQPQVPPELPPELPPEIPPDQQPTLPRIPAGKPASPGGAPGQAPPAPGANQSPGAPGDCGPGGKPGDTIPGDPFSDTAWDPTKAKPPDSPSPDSPDPQTLPSLAEAEQNVAAARAALQAAEDASFDAFKEEVDYQPHSIYRAEHPGLPPADPLVEEALDNQTTQADQDAVRAINELRAAQKTLNAVQDAARLGKRGSGLGCLFQGAGRVAAPAAGSSPLAHSAGVSPAAQSIGGLVSAGDLLGSE